MVGTLFIGIGKARRSSFLAAAAVLAALVLLAYPAAAAEPAASAPPSAPEDLLPTLEGWTRDGDLQIFTPETLFEYIDGAADAYLSFEFVELAAVSYNGENRRSVTIEIYRHRDLRNAFGIYTQERPQQGNFVEIGTEGYYDTGIVHFFHGPYYVKVMGFRLEEDDEAILTGIAKSIAENIGGTPEFPDLLVCFPSEDRVARSERYFARDVLGHGFLHSAYTADYERNGIAVRLYLFEGVDEADARGMLADYLKLAGADSRPTPGRGRPETFRFRDPRRADQNATFTLSGRFFWGMFETIGSEHDYATMPYMKHIESNLKERGLIR